MAGAVEDDEVTVVEARRLDADADLAMAGFGLADVDLHETTGTGMAIHMIGFHGCSFPRAFTWMSRLCKV
ncbi:hypothetical protein SSBR45G_34740 [Bradyrhizobium sp. SSBR45G]|nr:hypothetical protein SSBR45G_34740 [Bradyrhizobium sp. SSBR45G]GLH86349.1 hypothetical protein SSBR45R_38090 [Bradyrhizobium sp. SSBR45R]